MARRNQNTFLKRQKEMERVRKAKEKMARRQGKVLTEEVPHLSLGPAGTEILSTGVQDIPLSRE